MTKSKSFLNRKKPQKQGDSVNKAMPIILLLISIACLLVAHFDFNNFFWLFIAGLILFSFTIAYFLVPVLEYFLPSVLVNHQFWTGKGIGGKGLAGLIYGILAIAIMLGTAYLLKIMNVGYIN